MALLLATPAAHATETEFGRVSFKGVQVVNRPIDAAMRAKFCKSLLSTGEVISNGDFQEVRDEVQRYLHDRSRAINPQNPVVINRNGVQIRVSHAMMALAAEQILAVAHGVPLQRVPKAIALWVQYYTEGPLRQEQLERKAKEEKRLRELDAEGPVRIELVSQYAPLEDGLPSNSRLLQTFGWGARLLIQNARVETLQKKKKIAGDARNLLSGFQSGEEERIELGLADNVAQSMREVRQYERLLEEKRALYGIPRTEKLPAEPQEAINLRKEEAALVAANARLQEILAMEKIDPATLPDDAARKAHNGVITKGKDHVEKTIVALRQRLPATRAALKEQLGRSSDPRIKEWSESIQPDRPLPSPEESIAELDRVNSSAAAARLTYNDFRQKLLSLIVSRSQELWLPEVGEALEIAEKMAANFLKHREATLEVRLTTGENEAKYISDRQERLAKARETLEEVEGTWKDLARRQYELELAATRKGFERALRIDDEMLSRAAGELEKLPNSQRVLAKLSALAQAARRQREIEQEIDDVTVEQDRAEALRQERSYLDKATQIMRLSQQAGEAKANMVATFEEIAALPDSQESRIAQRTAALLSALWQFTGEERLKAYSTRRALVLLEVAGAIDLNPREISLAALESELVKMRANFDAALFSKRASLRMADKIATMLTDLASASESSPVNFDPEELLQEAVIVLSRMLNELELVLPINGTSYADPKRDPHKILSDPPTQEELKKIPSPVKRVAPDGTVSFEIPMPGLRSAYVWHPQDSTTRVAPPRGTPLTLGEIVMLVPGMGGERSVDVFTHGVANLLMSWGLNPSTTLPPLGGQLGPMLEGVLTRLAFYVQIAENEDQSLGGSWRPGEPRFRSPWQRDMWGRSMGGWLVNMLALLGVDSHVVDSRIGVSVTLPRSREELDYMLTYLMKDAHRAGRKLDAKRMEDANRLCYESYVLIKELLAANPNFSRRLGKNLGIAQGSSDVDALVHREDGLRHPHEDIEKARLEGIVPLLAHQFYFFDLEQDPNKPDERTEQERKGKQGGHFLFSGDPTLESEGTQLGMYAAGLTDYLIAEGEANARQKQKAEVLRKKNSTVLYYPGIDSQYAKVEAGANLNELGLKLGLDQDLLNRTAKEYAVSLKILETTELDGPNVSRTLRGAAELAKDALYSTDKRNQPAAYQKNLAFRFLWVMIYWEKEAERVKRAEAQYFQIEPPRVDPALDNPKPFSWAPLAEGGENGRRYWYPLGITGEPAMAPLQPAGSASPANPKK